MSRSAAPSLAIVLLLLLIVPARGDARPTVTFAARVCPSFADVPANLRPTDAPRALGAPARYTPTAPVSPAVERRAQGRCAPLSGARFTLGRGIAPTGAAVSAPSAQAIVTASADRLRDQRGRPIAGRSLKGAVTVPLTGAQARASVRGALWAQGGTPAAPLGPQGQQPAALRCGPGTAASPNAQPVAFDAGTSHAYCFAYYVGGPGLGAPPPESLMTITIVVKVAGAPPDFSIGVPFDGSLATVRAGGSFVIPVAGSQGTRTFTGLAGGSPIGVVDDPWTVRELVPDDPRLRFTGADCTTTETTVNADYRPSVDGTTATIPGLSGSTATCVFNHEYLPPVSFRLTKSVRGEATATTFPVQVTGLDDPAKSFSSSFAIAGSAATDAIDFPVQAPGRFRVTEQRPAAGGEDWSLTGVTCDGTPVALAPSPAGEDDDGPLGAFEVDTGASRGCELINTYTPPGALALGKVSYGATGPVGFRVTPPRDATPLMLAATTTREGERAAATGAATGHLPLGTYTIQELVPDGDDSVLTAVSCDGELLPFSQGQAQVTLTRADPAVSCTFTNVRPAAADDERAGDEPAPPFAPPGATAEPGSAAAAADITIDKQVVTREARVGEDLEYLLRVTNRGPGRAEDVVVDDDPAVRAALVSADVDGGRCTDTLPAACYVGALAAGETATVHVVLRPGHAGLLRNGTVVGLSSYDPRVTADNRDQVATVVRRARPPGPSGAPKVTG